MPKYKILKFNAKKLLTCCEDNGSYTVNLDKTSIYSAVVDELLTMDICALFDQLMLVLEQKAANEINDSLLHELVIVDFTEIYKKKSSKLIKSKVQHIIENGFVIKSGDRQIHMMPFDKSGNMSRNCRISFINAERLDEMNKRLNLEIDFSNIEVNLSKYYAYRGLYLSTATRIEHPDFIINPETFIVLHDTIDPDEVTHFSKKKTVLSANVDDRINGEIDVKFEDPKEIAREEILVPFDGQGFISIDYAGYINEVLYTDGKRIGAFQIRLPFAKGMLYDVDFHDFLNEYDDNYQEYNDTPYFITDAFGIKRDLKKAQIILTKSMFKCAGWLQKHCKTHSIPDPMQFYCEQLNNYNHALYVSGTDLPYGHSKITHLSYQYLNTLCLDEEQFQKLISNHISYIENPVKYIELCNGFRAIDNDSSNKAEYVFPNWQRAVIANPAFSKLKHIKGQLTNIQASLKTKLALGKIIVEGQTRYFARDLLFMLLMLIQTKSIKDKYKGEFKLFPYRFFLPQGDENLINLDYKKWYGFLRSPHLSRNEEAALKPFTVSEGIKASLIYNNYFGHLTGTVIVGMESLDPMALGGADFDGDLVCIVADRSVADAIMKGYDANEDKAIPYIKIPSPSNTDKEETVPHTVPFSLVDSTFSNRVGIISDAAISIGQKEYGQKQKGDLSCAQCTILTGLEIDAAKNGCRPNIDVCSNVEPCAYLKFKKAFEKLRKEKDYHFNNLKLVRKGKKYGLFLDDTESIEYFKEKGTCINELPILFMENLDTKLNIPYNKSSKYFKFPKSDADSKEFAKQCQNILDIYSYYCTIQRRIADKVKTEYNHRANIENLLWAQYDEAKVEQIKENALPTIYSVVANKINSKDELKVFKNNINSMRWHLMNTAKRQAAIIEMFDLTEEQFAKNKEAWDIVLNPYQQGYKLLWYIVMDVCQSLTISYSDFIGGLEEKETFVSCDLSKNIEKQLSQSLQNKETFCEKQIYTLCFEKLMTVLSKSNLDIAAKMETLFNLTKSKNKEASFFWDSFSWEDISKYIVKEDGNA